MRNMLILVALLTPAVCLAQVMPPTIPPSFEDRVIYYNSFDGPAINTEGLTEPRGLSPITGGILGRCLDCAKSKAFTLTGEALSPHRPLSLSLWWCMTKDTPIDGGLGILHIQGKGIISNFVRGKGEWCGLQKPCAVFQVYYFPGIGNVNGLYDGAIWDRGMLKAGVWHNTVLTIAAGHSLYLYTDGQVVCHVETTGRPFAPEDGIRSVSFGSEAPMLIAEIMVVDRALADWEVADYHTIVRQTKAAYGH